MPGHQVNLMNCLVLKSKEALKEIPYGIVHYFVNSRRRFFVYFKQQEQMINVMKVLSQNNIPFYRRQSLLPDREEQQQLVFHCNYRFKRHDLRKNLHPSTPYNDPKVLFDKYQRAKNKFQPLIRLSSGKQLNNVEENPQKHESQIQIEQKEPEIKEKPFKNDEITAILSNRNLIKKIFLSLNMS